jgi:hypothetical protein
VSQKTLGNYDASAGGNEGHLNDIKDKTTTWVYLMTSGHLPSHIAWVTYKHQLWPGLKYGLGTMTNNINPAVKMLDKVNLKMLNVPHQGFYGM